MKIIYFNYAAFALLIVLFLSAAFRKIGMLHGNRAFLIVLGQVTLTTFFDTAAVALDNLGGGYPVLKFIAHLCYLIFHTLSSGFYLIYIISLTETWHLFRRNRLLRCFVILPALLYLAAFAASYSLGVPVFYVDASGAYVRGAMFGINYLIAALYLIYGVYYIIRNRRLFTVKWIIMLFSPYPVILAAMAVEFLMPQMIIEMFFNALALLFIYTNIQRPDDLKDAATNMGSLEAYENYCKKIYINKKPMVAILLAVVNYDFLRDLFDFEGETRLQRKLAELVASVDSTLNLKAQLFYGREGRFYLLAEMGRMERANEAAILLQKEMNDAVVVNDLEIYPKTTVCMVSVPDDISEFDNYMHFCGKGYQNVRAGKIYKAAELFNLDYYKVIFNIDRIISEAIENHYLEVYYQPIYSIPKKKYVAAEALMRLRHPTYGFISPDVFIRAAEKSGEINRIWDFLVESVCTFIASDDFRQLGLSHIEINLSAVQCVQEKLAESILQKVDAYGIERRLVSLEITETAFAFDMDVLRANLDALALAGMRICLDDYGTGYSDTRRIVDLPVSVVKLDKSFVDTISNQNIQIIIRDTVHMLRAIGMDIIAEGVEDAETVRMLRDCGCQFIQGYYFSKPVPRDQFVAVCLQGPADFTENDG